MKYRDFGSVGVAVFGCNLFKLRDSCLGAFLFGRNDGSVLPGTGAGMTDALGDRDGATKGLFVPRRSCC